MWIQWIRKKIEGHDTPLFHSNVDKALYYIILTCTNVISYVLIWLLPIDIILRIIIGVAFFIINIIFSIMDSFVLWLWEYIYKVIRNNKFE